MHVRRASMRGLLIFRRLASGMSAIGTKRTSLVAPHMSAFDPKRTSDFYDGKHIRFLSRQLCVALGSLHLRREALWARAADAIKEAGSEPRSAEINARGPIHKAADITKNSLPLRTCIAAVSQRCYISRAAAPTLVS